MNEEARYLLGDDVDAVLRVAERMKEKSCTRFCVFPDLCTGGTWIVMGRQDLRLFPEDDALVAAARELVRVSELRSRRHWVQRPPRTPSKSI